MPFAVWVALACASAAGGTAPSFPELLREAEKSAPRLHEIDATVAAAQGLVRQASAWPNPVVGVEVEDILGSGPYHGSSQAQTTYSISEPLELGGQRGARIAAARADERAAEAQRTQARLDFAFELAVAYAQAEAAQIRTAVQAEDLARAQEDVRAARALVTAGALVTADEVDLSVAQTDAAAATAQAELDAARADQVDALGRLSSLVGRAELYSAVTPSLLNSKATVATSASMRGPRAAPTGALASERREMSAITLASAPREAPAIDPASAPREAPDIGSASELRGAPATTSASEPRGVPATTSASAPREAPAIQAAVAARDAAERRLVVEQKRLLATPSLTIGSRRYAADNAHAWVFGVSLPLPLFDRNRGAVAAARAELIGAQAREHAARLETSAASQAAWAQLRAAESRRAAADQAETAAREVYRLARVGYEAGRMPLIELSSTRRALIEAQTTALDARVARVTAAASLARLTGRVPFAE